MSCAGCALTVQRAIEAQPGVVSANVNVTNGRATVTGANLNANRLVAVVQDSGYEAEPIAEHAAPHQMRSDIEHHHHENERLWRQRAIIGLALWLPLELMHWLVHAHGSWMDWVMFVGSTIVLVVAGGGFYASAWRAARRGGTNMDTLVALGATTAYVFSLVVFI
ncbi:MAG: cation transporter, partial [Myxococcota bacterium]